MFDYQDLLHQVTLRKGDLDTVFTTLPQCLPHQQLATLDDHSILSSMAKCVFQAGFVWRVIEQKWPGFEAAFHNFNVRGTAHLSDTAIETLLQDTRIVRNRQKILAVRENASMILSIAEQHGSAAQWIADWPNTNILGLWQALEKRGSRLGGATGPRVLRTIGKDTFLLTQDVQRALIQFELAPDMGSNSKRFRQAAQDAFLRLHEESGRPLCQISRLLSYTQ